MRASINLFLLLDFFLNEVHFTALDWALYFGVNSDLFLYSSVKYHLIILNF